MLWDLIRWLLRCRHPRLGRWFRRGHQEWRTCLECGQTVPAGVQLDGQAENHRLTHRRTQEPKDGLEMPTGIERMERKWLDDMGVKW